MNKEIEANSQTMNPPIPPREISWSFFVKNPTSATIAVRKRSPPQNPFGSKVPTLYRMDSPAPTATPVKNRNPISADTPIMI